jgi:outer membrane protein assembly factor BamB
MVYVTGARGRLAAVDLQTGAPVWEIDLRKEFDAQVPRWGVSSSPLVESDRLIVEVGGRANHAFVAFDKRDGQVVWNSGTGKPGYASPIAVTLSGRRQIVFFPAQGLVGVAAEDGQPLWSVPWKTSYDVNAATPIFVPRNSLFISTGYDTGAGLVEVTAEGEGLQADFVWKNRSMKNHFNSSVLVGDLIYGFDNAVFKCIEVRSGDEIWRARGGYGKGASLLYADDLLIVLGGEGLLGLVEATPEGYREISTAQVAKGRTWTMPSLANGVLYIRDFKQLVALKVGP